MVASSGLVSHADFRLHDPGWGHPESPRRLEAVIGELRHSGLLEHFLPIPPRPATNDDLLRCHSRAYLASVRRDIRSGLDQLSTGDTAVSEHSEAVARLAAGGLLAALDAVMAGAVRNAFCAVRPPGHHAESNRGMGFCLFNNVAVAARYAQAVQGLRRVLILDWDVHHGNGSQEIFWRDPSVLVFSVHESPLYPGSGAASERGAGEGEGFTINVPLPPGSGGAAVLAALEEQLLPAAERFEPELVLISAGFDARLGDPLGHQRLNDDDFHTLTRIAMAIAARHCSGRLVSSLEGGYGLEGLGLAVAAHGRALLEP
ncbi:histone deacetylase [Cyanobium sp. Morenito 9A2]|uniref:histone deacetylase family protein n=1 Tax=Cyanobium sp. Morenito 9A2 TaxID=2823718 RepID=UPI0020CDB765|nr:histone deacetylase [Cyanobium sp. Morenito 9A2]MCP9850750.1 histone deacetylase [Cyanobium sp. Morenito 9A2]